jgi:hypothetical protein
LIRFLATLFGCSMTIADNAPPPRDAAAALSQAMAEFERATEAARLAWVAAREPGVKLGDAIGREHKADLAEREAAAPFRDAARVDSGAAWAGVLAALDDGRLEGFGFWAAQGALFALESSEGGRADALRAWLAGPEWFFEAMRGEMPGEHPLCAPHSIWWREDQRKALAPVCAALLREAARGEGDLSRQARLALDRLFVCATGGLDVLSRRRRDNEGDAPLLDDFSSPSPHQLCHLGSLMAAEDSPDDPLFALAARSQELLPSWSWLGAWSVAAEKEPDHPAPPPGFLLERAAGDAAFGQTLLLRAWCSGSFEGALAVALACPTATLALSAWAEGSGDGPPIFGTPGRFDVQHFSFPLARAMWSRPFFRGTIEAMGCKIDDPRSRLESKIAALRFYATDLPQEAGAALRWLLAEAERAALSDAAAASASESVGEPLRDARRL